MSSLLLFTRYLYEKEYVKSALTLSLLNYEKDAALFWAFELFYSGYIHEVFHHVITIYYDYYFLLNTAFEKYIVKQVEEKTAISLYLIIMNMLKRKYTIDVLMLKTFATHWQNDLISPSCADDIIDIVTQYDDGIVDLSLWLFKDAIVDFETMFLDALTLLHVNIKELKKIFRLPFLCNIHKKQACIGRIISAMKPSIKQCRPIYIVEKEGDGKIIQQYQTHYDHSQGMHNLQPHEVLAHETHFGFNDKGMEYLSLFHVNQHDVQQALLYHWEYHAFRTPLWNRRFLCHSASIVINENKEDIVFENGEYEEYFYEWYAYAPDEQSVHVQQKLIHTFDPQITVSSFIMKYGTLNVLDIPIDLIC